MEELDTPASPEDLYRDRGEVPVTVPLMQGDVFDEITVPGLPSDSITVQVVLHPCSMRNGAVLRERIAVAPVTALAGGYSGKLWATKHVNRMLLPDLREDGDAHAADFLDVTSIPSGGLSLDKRIATLSTEGVVLLQQRHTYSLARVAIPKREFEQALLPITTELEMQESWVERACPSATTQETPNLHDAISAFHEWLDANDRERRNKLASPTTHSALRRELASELRARFGTG